MISFVNDYDHQAGRQFARMNRARHHASPFDGTYDAEVLRGLAELLNRIQFEPPELAAFQGDAVDELRIIADRLERR